MRVREKRHPSQLRISSSISSYKSSLGAPFPAAMSRSAASIIALSSSSAHNDGFLFDVTAGPKLFGIFGVQKEGFCPYVQKKQS